MSHDYAGCRDLACALCDAYGDGYTAGKDKAYSELEYMAHDYDPEGDCGCRPCVTIRGLLRRFPVMPACVWPSIAQEGELQHG